MWSNYQTLFFAHDFIVDKFRLFYEAFYKMAIAKNYEQNGQVIAISVIDVNELKKRFQQTR